MLKKYFKSIFLKLNLISELQILDLPEKIKFQICEI